MTLQRIASSPRSIPLVAVGCTLALAGLLLYLFRKTVRKDEPQRLPPPNPPINVVPLEAWEKLAQRVIYDPVPNDPTPEKFHEWLKRNRGELAKIRVIDLSNCRINSFWFQNVTSYLPSLEDLRMAMCNLVTLPEPTRERIYTYRNGDFRAFPESLQELDLTCNRLESFPVWLTALQTLTKLDVSINGLSDLPNTMSRMTRLKVCRVTNNILTSLGTIDHIDSLEKLDIFANRISNLPSSFTRLTRLTSIEMAYHFENIPDVVFLLTNLQSLKMMRSAQPLQLQEEITKLLNLTELDLSENRIASIPPFLDRLSNLRCLDLQDNHISSIPPTFGNFSQLSALNLSKNRLSEIPLPLARLSSQCRFIIERNPISNRNREAFLREVEQTHGPRTYFSVYEEPRTIPTHSLRETLVFWENLFKEAFPEQFREFSYEVLTTCRDLNPFLVHLRDSDDFKCEKRKKNLVYRLRQILEGASLNEEFRIKMFALLEHANASCTDRVTEYFNLIEVQWRILCESKTLDERGVAMLCIGLGRLDLLDRFANNFITTLRAVDPIEVFLKFKVRLKEALHLPITTHGMLYNDAARVPDEQIERAKEFVLSKTTKLDDILEILCHYDIWVDRLKKLHPAPFQEIDIDTVEKMENDSAMKGVLIEQQKTRTRALVVELTRNWLSEHKDLIQ